MNRSPRLTVGLLLVVAVAVACGGGGGGAQPPPPGPTGWTVLVYTAADNDLEPFALLNLEQMAAVGSSAGLNIVAEVDRAPLGKYTSASNALLNLAPWSTAKRLLVKKGSFQEISDLGEINTADPANLADFIQWGVKTYPAAHYMLVLWDHGGGWQGFGLDQTVPGSASSEMMGLLRIQTGVQSGLSQAGLAKFDIVGFDACLMASFEVAESLKPYANYLVASEETEPGHGWDYSASLSGAATLDALSLAKKIADGYKAIANTAPWNDGASITLSVLDLSKLGPIETGIAKIAMDYGTGPTITPIMNAIGQGRAATVAFGGTPDNVKTLNLLDMGDLFLHLSAMGADATAMRTAVQGAVIYKVNGSAFAGASGMSIYFPPTSASYQATVYDALPGTANWRTFLSAYYGTAASAVTPTFASASYSATHTSITLDGILAAGALPSVTTAQLMYGVPGASADGWLYGDQPAQTSTDAAGDHVMSTWDYSFLHLSQTTPAAHDEYGYISVRTIDASTGLIIVPMSYYAPSSAAAQSAFREIVFTFATGALLADVYYVESNGLLGQLTPTPGSTLRARVVHLPTASTFSGGWVDSTSTGAFDATAPINLQFVSLGTGAPFLAGLRVTNVNGNGDWVATSATTPPTRP